MRNMTFSPAETSTLRIALIGWGVRCEAEARTMEKWADEEKAKGGDLEAKCRANAAASRRMKADADALLAKPW